MFGTSWHIGCIFGIPLRIHISWFLVFALVVWSLARYYFPAVLSQSPPWEYWVLGVVAALLLFASVMVHELGHCLVALRYRIPIAQITLFIFGGLAQIRREAPTPRAELLLDISRPVVARVGTHHVRGGNGASQVAGENTPRRAIHRRHGADDPRRPQPARGAGRRQGARRRHALRHRAVFRPQTTLA